MSLANDILDQERLLREFEGDPELLANVLEAFEREYGERLARLKRALKEGDRWTYNRESHACKRSVSTFFARAAFDAAADMETWPDPAKVKRFEAETERCERPFAI